MRGVDAWTTGLAVLALMGVTQGAQRGRESVALVTRDKLPQLKDMAAALMVCVREDDQCCRTWLQLFM